MKAAISTEPLRRVLIVNRVGHLGGVERVILNLAPQLPAYGYRAIVACPGEGALANAARVAGIEVAPVPFDRMRISADPRVMLRYPLLWHRGAAAVEQICRERQIDLIHVHHPVGSLYARRAARALALPVLFHVHEALPTRLLYALAARRALRDCAGTVCVSSAGTALLRHLGDDLSRNSVVNNGLAASFLDDAPPAPAAEVTGPGPHIGVFGVIEPRKGQDVFLAAATKLVTRYPDAQFWIVGPLALKDKQSFEARIKTLAEAPPLRGRVHFVGFRPDVGAWLRAMNVVVQASVKHESLSMVLLEAMALGRPVVATDVGGTADGVTNGRTGLLVPPNDAEALAIAIEQALEPGGAILGEAAAREARLHFSPEAFARNMARVFDTMLAARAVNRPAMDEMRQPVEATVRVRS
jgi:glycosyltransferase involved in cell wall biosynthesis